MAIEKNYFKVTRLDSEMLSSKSRDESMSSDEDEFLKAVESDDEDDDDEFDECDSGAGSDDFDLLELGGTGEEFVQVGDQTCSVPIELYDLPGFGDILSMDVWNDCLTEEDRFNLTKYLPDMDQEMFMRTLKEIFTGCNMHFGSPVNRLFEMFKGGLCEPRVALYRQGMNYFHHRKHYHFLRKHQNSMVSNLYQIRDAWANCRGYSIEEKLQVLNIMKSQKSLMHEKMEEFETDSSDRDGSVDGLWTKSRKLGQKIIRYPGNRLSPTLDFSSRGRHMALEPATYGKPNQKGTLKVGGSKMSTTKELAGRFAAVHHGMEIKSPPYGSALAPPRQNNASGYEEAMYEVAVQRDRSFPKSGPVDKAGPFNFPKKYGSSRGEEYSDSFVGLPMSLNNDVPAYGRNRTVNQLSDIEVLTAKPSNPRVPYDYGKARTSKLSTRESQIELSDGVDPFWQGKAQGGPFPIDPSSKYGDWNTKSKKRKLSQEKDRVMSMHKGRRDVAALKDIGMFRKGEETDSDSSEESEDDDDDNPLMRSKWAYPTGVSGVNSALFSKKSKFVKNDSKSGGFLGGSSQSSRKMGHLGEHLHMAEGDNYATKAKQKSKMHDNSFLPGPGRVNGDDDEEDWGERYKIGRNGNLHGERDERFAMSSLKPYHTGRRQKMESVGHYSFPQSTYLQDHIVDDDDDSLGVHKLVKDTGAFGRMRKKGGQKFEDYEDDHHEISNFQLLECKSLTKKRKIKDDFTPYMDESDQQEFDDVTPSKKRAKKKMEDNTGNLEKRASEPPFTDAAAEDVDIESKQVKKPFPLITPTVHTGFSFSIIHFLSAVRMAMITLLPDDTIATGKHHDNNDQDKEQEGISGVNLQGDNSVPTLTVQDIVNRVRSNPGDPCILETQEPLQDLVRGVLKIFSSKTAPLGAKGWKTIVLYEKSTKSWSWVGPVPQSPSDHEATEEVTSPESWGLPHKMIVKLVDSFANWLKSGQETLRQIGSLPPPPLTLMQPNLDEKERFRDLRAQKSLNTINPSSSEVRDYFRMEEVLRYSIPDRAFSYTAIDGKKSIVAPLRRCGGKPTSKARDHFMLKRDRPPHVTILCLVRDAASRLPGSIGTRADVCTLIRDSQYIVEDVSDAQVNQVVSGALDRLHYERDPCVQFDGERKLWVYLHREREEEDFEDDGTSSTKKWKRQKKEALEPSEQGTVTVAYNGDPERDHTGFDLSSDLNVDLSCTDDDKKVDLLYFDDRHRVADNVVGLQSEQGAMNPGPSMVWEAFDLNPVRENRLLCQENSTNEDFGKETFGREQPADLLGSSLS